MRTIHQPAILAGCLLALAGCSSTVVREAPRTGAVRSASVPRPGESVAVQRGDTLYAIATRHGIAAADLAAWNAIAPPYTIYPGQRLRLYPRSAVARPSPSRTPTGRPRSAAGGSAAASTPPHRTPPATPQAPAPVVDSAPPQSDVAWRWPAEGPLLGRFAAGEPTRQGVDIGGTAGSPVRAAGDGTVVYSGSGLVGYGELVIIKHNDAWLSAYGHNRKRLVNEGQIVKAGEQIAEMGHSGAARDMLHFEIRYNGRPVDPLRYLPAR